MLVIEQDPAMVTEVVVIVLVSLVAETEGEERRREEKIVKPSNRATTHKTGR